MVRALLTEVATPGPGQCILHNIEGRLFVERADPVIAIATAMIGQIRRGEGHPSCHLDAGMLVIDGANQRVVYRLTSSGQPGFLLGHAC